MKKLIPLLILTLGVVVSASFGARLGPQHSEYRLAQGRVDAAEGDSEKAAAVAARDAIGLPTPAQRVGEWFSEGGLGWLLGSGLILLGAVVARRQLAAENAGTDEGASGDVDFPGTVRRALEVVDQLEADLAEFQMDADHPSAREAIDTLMDEVIGPMVDGRGQLVARHGIGGFAEYFGPFSGGERNLARVWSAITDGHAPEARASVLEARAGFEQALRMWDSVESAG